jgi:protein tyrosine/serine phosphatase
MKNKKSPVGLIILLLAVSVVVLLVKNFHIKDFNIVSPGVLYTSAQPRGMDYTRLLYRYHIATIVNVRTSYEHRERNWHNEEVVWVRNNGVNYIELPFEKRDRVPDANIQERFLAVMADSSNFPVLLHGSGDDGRVAMLTAVWLTKTKGYNLEKTLAEVKKIVYGRELTEVETGFINDLVK